MKVLMAYPWCPDTFWSYRRALKFIKKKAAFPPLGLLTVAAMLPKDWNLKLVDLNVRPLDDEDIKWADMVFVSAMLVQKTSAQEIIDRCKKLGKTVVAGGPAFTSSPEIFQGVDHFVLGETEGNLPDFLRDHENGTLKSVYAPKDFLPLKNTPLPMWSLINMKNYYLRTLSS